MTERFKLGYQALGRPGGVAATVVVGSEVVVELAGGEQCQMLVIIASV